jgi:peptidyl-prolyl cis-trans isomerase A (cyclophilin A)
MNKMRRLLSVSAAAFLLGLSGCATAAGRAPVPDSPRTILLNPQHVEMTQEAPDRFKAWFETTEGDFIVEVNREWAPQGADRFFNLVRNGYYDGVRFFRVIPGFVVQFGIHGDPEISRAWREARIPDDSVAQSNRRGTITFATAGADTRTVQVFINLVDNQRLDAMGFAPFGEVIGGMDAVDRLYAEFGEGAPRGRGPDQGRMQDEGEEYLARDFDALDRVIRARILEP